MHFSKPAISTLCLLNLASFVVADKKLRDRNLQGISKGPPGKGPPRDGDDGEVWAGDPNGTPRNPKEDVEDYIVLFKDPKAHAEFRKNEMGKYNNVRSLNFMNGEVLKLPNEKAARQWARRDDVLLIERDGDMWILAEEVPYGINMVEALGIPYVANSGVKACVIDTGYGLDHPDLQNSLVTGFNPYEGQSGGGQWDVDGHGHGTHVAGTMAALANGVGVVGVTSNGQMPLRIGKGLTDSGSGTTSGVLAAMEDCVEAGARVINMSLGGGGPSESVMQFLSGLEDQGKEVLFVAAAGNGGSPNYSYPASYDSPLVMSVAAVDSNSDKASFSQYNDQVDIAAPGVGVKSPITTNSGQGFNYASWSGTSMASPHVAGVAALIWSHHPNKSAAEIRLALECSAVMPEDYGNEIRNDEVGYGVVNAKNALAMLDSGNFDGCPGTAPTSAPTPFECPSGKEHMEVIIKTDNYPTETSWSLTNTCTSSVVLSASAGDYSTSNTEYTEEVCVSPGGKYSFVIADTYGDGICCSYGDGYYRVERNGAVEVSGGQFNDQDTKTFGQCGTLPPSPAPSAPPTSAPSAPPTSAPSAPPTSPPSAPPTPAPQAPPTPAPQAPPTPAPQAPPTPAPSTTSPTVEPPSPSPSPSPSSSCLSGQVEFSIALRTDDFPGETKWVLKEGNNWKTASTVASRDYGFYADPQASYFDTECINENETFIFRILDRFRDGICCEHGAGEYWISLNGGEAFHVGGNFGRKETVQFTVSSSTPNDLSKFTIEVEKVANVDESDEDKEKEEEG